MKKENENINWYLVNTKPRQEVLASESLRRVGVEIFFPQLRENKPVQRKIQPVITPLFPRYLFVRFNKEIHYRAVNYSRGVHHLVSFGSELAIVDVEVIESIRSREVNGYVSLNRPSFIPGETVRIQNGPFEGWEAVFDREMSDQKRVVLLLQMVTGQTRLVLDIESVAAI